MIVMQASKLGLNWNKGEKNFVLEEEKSCAAFLIYLKNQNTHKPLLLCPCLWAEFWSCPSSNQFFSILFPINLSYVCDYVTRSSTKQMRYDLSIFHFCKKTMKKLNAFFAIFRWIPTKFYGFNRIRWFENDFLVCFIYGNDSTPNFHLTCANSFIFIF